MPIKRSWQHIVLNINMPKLYQYYYCYYFSCYATVDTYYINRMDVGVESRITTFDT